MTQNFSTSPTVLVYWASTGVRWSTQLLILTSLWWGAMCSHYWLLRTSVDQHALEYKVWWILHVLIYLPIQLHQVRTCIIQYCYTLNVSNTRTNAAAIIASLTDITSHTVIISTSVVQHQLLMYCWLTCCPYFVSKLVNSTTNGCDCHHCYHTDNHNSHTHYYDH